MRATGGPGVDRVTQDKLLNCIRQSKDAVNTPLYIYSAEQLDLAAERLYRVFPSAAQLFYSLKANPQPGIVTHFARRGIRPEIASAGERQLCLQADVPAEDILIGGVSKSSGYLAEICESGSYAVVIDSLAEWNRLKALACREEQPRVLLRIAPGVPLGGLDMAASSQFGLNVQQAMLMARECATGSALFQGLHFYFGSQRLTNEPIVKTLDIVMETLRTFRAEGLQVPLVDVGLGCGVPYLEKDRALDYEALAEQLRARWQDPVWAGVEIWSEAGRALVGQAGYYVSRVTEVKQLHGKTFVFLDGGLNNHNPGVGLGRFLRSNPEFLFVTEARSDNRFAVNLVGNLCSSADVIGQDVSAPELREDDLVVIPNSGAYMQTTALWGFNSQRLFSEMMMDAGGALTALVPQHELWLQANHPNRSNRP